MGYFLKFPQKLSLPTENVAKIIFVPLLKSLMDLWNLLTPGGTSLPRMRHDIGKIFMGKPRAKKSDDLRLQFRGNFFLIRTIRSLSSDLKNGKWKTTTS